MQYIEYMYKDIYSKLNIVVNNKEKLKFDSVEKRLITFLLNQNSKVITIKQSEIGFNIDSTRESVSRKLKEIERLGYIKLNRGKITILKDINELLDKN